MRNWILNDDGTIREATPQQWGEWFETAQNRVLRKTEAGDAEVSTVFIGLDMSHWGNPNRGPLLWETMVFGGENDDYQERYSSSEKALQRHEEIVQALREGKRIE